MPSAAAQSKPIPNSKASRLPLPFFLLVSLCTINPRFPHPQSRPARRAAAGSLAKTVIDCLRWWCNVNERVCESPPVRPFPFGPNTNPASSPYLDGHGDSRRAYDGSDAEHNQRLLLVFGHHAGDERPPDEGADKAPVCLILFLVCCFVKCVCRACSFIHGM